MHPRKQWHCCSLRFIGTITCQRCSNYIFILDLIPGFNELDKHISKTRQETCKVWDLVQLILETWWCVVLSMPWLWCHGNKEAKALAAMILTEFYIVHAVTADVLTIKKPSHNIDTVCSYDWRLHTVKVNCTVNYNKTWHEILNNECRI